MANRAMKLVDAGGGVGELREFSDGDALTLPGAVNEAAGVTLASAATVAIGAAPANTITISGTVTITAFDVADAGITRRAVFGGALTLTHSGTALILPTGASIATAAGDVAEFLSLGSGNWRCIAYQRASGQPLAGGGGPSDGKWYVFRNGVLVEVPYYETTVSWTAGGLISVNHNLGVVPRFVLFEVVALTNIGELTTGQSEEIGVGFLYYGASQYGAEAKSKGVNSFSVRVGSGGFVITQANGAALGVSNAQVSLKIKVFGF